jgi:hypothetical protein
MSPHVAFLDLAPLRGASKPEQTRADNAGPELEPLNPDACTTAIATIERTTVKM